MAIDPMIGSISSPEMAIDMMIGSIILAQMAIDPMIGSIILARNGYWPDDRGNILGQKHIYKVTLYHLPVKNPVGFKWKLKKLAITIVYISLVYYYSFEKLKYFRKPYMHVI